MPRLPFQHFANLLLADASINIIGLSIKYQGQYYIVTATTTQETGHSALREKLIARPSLLELSPRVDVQIQRPPSGAIN